MLKAYKYRIYPGSKQETLINKTLGCTRFVYNNILSYKIDSYKKEGKSLSKIDCNNYCNRVLKKDYPFLREVDKFALTNSIYNMDSSFQKFFKEGAGFPKFKNKHSKKQSYTTNYTNGNIKVFFDINKIQIPKVGKIRVKIHRLFSGIIKSATISKTSTRKYHISILVDEKIEELPRNNKKIGIDLGIKDLVITSEGIKYSNPKTLIKWENKIAKLQRRLSRKKKGSKRYIEVKNKIARCHEKISNIRKDNLHKISTKIVRENQIIVTEDLQVKNMMRNSKLSKVIGDASWYELTRCLEYKSQFYGRTYIKIDKFYASSQLCHICGYKNEKVKNLSIRNWQCPICNSFHDRDENAALNILKEGLKFLMI